MVEELLPAFVAFMAEVDVGQRIVPGLNGLFYQRHAGDFRGLAALSDVARRTGTNDIFPGCFAAQAPGDDVVEGQFAGREAFAAILTSVFVTGEDITPVEFHLVPRQAVVKQQPDDSRHGDIEIHCRDPIVPVRLEIPPEMADLAPALEIII